MLSPNEQILLRSFAEQTKADIQHAIKTKRITKFGAVPGQSTARVLDIKSWIQEKPVSTPLPTNTLAYLITRSISKKGNMVWRTHKGANSGLLEDALKQSKFDTFIDLIASKAVEGITDNIVAAFDIQEV